jgi:peptide/nickel transport system substrate-binding protein
MSRRRGRVGGLAAFVVCSLLVGGPVATSAASAGTQASPKGIDRTATIRYTSSSTFSNLDPVTGITSGDVFFQQLILERLLKVARGADGFELAPNLARSFEVAKDATSITFRLRTGVVFQDGAPFNAAAVKANLDRAVGPGSLIGSRLAGLQSVEVVNDSTVVVRLSAPDPSYIWKFATGGSTLMVSPAAFGTASAKPIGTGPFKLVSANRDLGLVVYERWADYREEDAVWINRLEVHRNVDTNVRFNGLRSGAFEIAALAPPTDIAAKPLTREGYHYVATSAISFSPVSVRLNLSKPPFNDVRVRRAVMMAINVKDISGVLLSDTSEPYYQPFPKGTVGFDPSLDKDRYNPKKAAKLVKAAGADGATFNVVALNNTPNFEIAQAVQQALRDIGLRAELVVAGSSDALRQWLTGEFAAMVASLQGSLDPATTLDLGYLATTPSAPPAELVTLANKAKALPVGSADREEAYQEISRYLVKNPVNVPIGGYPVVNVARPNVVGAKNLRTELVEFLDFLRIGLKKTKQ